MKEAATILLNDRVLNFDLCQLLFALACLKDRSQSVFPILQQSCLPLAEEEWLQCSGADKWQSRISSRPAKHGKTNMAMQCCIAGMLALRWSNSVTVCLLDMISSQQQDRVSDLQAEADSASLNTLYTNCCKSKIFYVITGAGWRSLAVQASHKAQNISMSDVVRLLFQERLGNQQGAVCCCMAAPENLCSSSRGGDPNLQLPVKAPRAPQRRVQCLWPVASCYHHHPCNTLHVVHTILYTLLMQYPTTCWCNGRASTN